MWATRPDTGAIRWDEGPGASLDTAAVFGALERAKSRPGFVAKQAGDVSGPLAAGVAQAVKIARELRGVPVQLIWSRPEDMQHDFYRPPSLHLMRAALANAVYSLTGKRIRSTPLTDGGIRFV